ncbi:MAG TPA: hypothetical protein VGO29_14135, partial [Solirubrobacteraceae bacterium]|nr:hypothetical protein [Solirubrobacteraceae bacterium]
NYNGRLRPQELLLRADGSVELIRRREEVRRDYFATLQFEPDVLIPPSELDVSTPTSESHAPASRSESHAPASAGESAREPITAQVS